MKKIILPALMVALAIPTVAAEAQRQRQGAWQTIGQKKVAFGVETDSFKARGNRLHRQVRICAFRDDLKLLDADVHFANGGEQDILGPKRSLRAGTCTAPMDLRGNRRDIVKVKLAYSRFNTGRAPVVSVQAR